MSDYNALSPEEQHIILHKGTERPFVGKYTDHYEAGGHYPYAANAIPHFTVQSTSFSPAAAGQRLTMKSQARCAVKPMRMVIALKLYAPNVTDT